MMDREILPPIRNAYSDGFVAIASPRWISWSGYSRDFHVGMVWWWWRLGYVRTCHGGVHVCNLYRVDPSYVHSGNFHLTLTYTIISTLSLPFSLNVGGVL